MSKRLNLELRILIEKHLGSGWSLRAIGSSLGVSVSTVSREVRRNGGAAGYAAAAAQRRARRMRGGVGPPRVGATSLAPALEPGVGRGGGERWSDHQRRDHPATHPRRRRARRNAGEMLATPRQTAPHRGLAAGATMQEHPRANPLFPASGGRA